MKPMTPETHISDSARKSERPIFLDGKLCYLSKHLPEDFSGPYLQGINNQALDHFTTHALFPKNNEDLEKYWLQKKESGDLWLSIISKETHKHIGNIEIGNINLLNRNGEYAIILWDESGRGIAQEASHLILKHAFTKLNLHRVGLGLNARNEKAHSLYKKLGFKEEGRAREALIFNNEFVDIIHMSILAEEYIQSRGV